ncbi:MAG TPA: type II toxin-antitoxin system VapB family antitoxin [Acidobacteriota bacterium]|jgi:hypothetical protein|nr:type II toxin-antitoxin system VapB family antitoxin [Acidobacteriota bacterium]
MRVLLLGFFIEDFQCSLGILSQLQVSGEKTKKAAVTKALKEFVARYEQVRIRELFGKLEWNQDFDYKKERSRK